MGTEHDLHPDGRPDTGDVMTDMLDQLMGRMPIPELPRASPPVAQSWREAYWPPDILEFGKSAAGPIGYCGPDPAAPISIATKFYARAPFDNTGVTGAPASKFWYEVADVQKLPSGWELMQAKNVAELVLQINERRGATAEIQFAELKQYERLADTVAPGLKPVDYYHEGVREYKLPRFLGNDLDIFMQIVRRDGRMPMHNVLIAEVQKRLQQEQRYYPGTQTRWTWQRYVFEHGFTVKSEDYGNRFLLRYDPERALKAAIADDEAHNEPLMKQRREERATTAGVQYQHLTNLVDALIGDLMLTSQIQYGTPAVRDPSGQGTACRTKGGWIVWLAHYLMVHQAVLGRDAYRRLPAYKRMMTQWRANKPLSRKTWKKQTNFLEWLEAEGRRRSQPPSDAKIEANKRRLYRFPIGTIESSDGKPAEQTEQFTLGADAHG